MGDCGERREANRVRELVLLTIQGMHAPHARVFTRARDGSDATLVV